MQRMHVLSLAMMSAVAFAPAASAQVGVDADVSLGGGSVADADVAVSLGGGSAADADVNASVGGGTGAVAGVGATVGGGSVADAGIDATVGGGSGTVAGAGVTAGSRGTGTGTGTGTQTAGGTNTTQDGDPQLVGRDLIGTDGVRLGVIAQVTRTMICTSDQRCLAYSTRPVLTAEGVLVNVSSDVFLR